MADNEAGSYDKIDNQQNVASNMEHSDANGRHNNTGGIKYNTTYRMIRRLRSRNANAVERYKTGRDENFVESNQNSDYGATGRSKNYGAADRNENNNTASRVGEFGASETGGIWNNMANTDNFRTQNEIQGTKSQDRDPIYEQNGGFNARQTGGYNNRYEDGAENDRYNDDVYQDDIYRAQQGGARRSPQDGAVRRTQRDAGVGRARQEGESIAYPDDGAQSRYNGYDRNTNNQYYSQGYAQSDFGRDGDQARYVNGDGRERYDERRRQPQYDTNGSRAPYNGVSGNRTQYNGANGGRAAYGGPDDNRPQYNGPNGGRASYNGANGERQPYSGANGERQPYSGVNGERQPYNVPSGERQQYNGPNGERQQYNGPNGGRSAYGVPDDNRPQFNGPNGERQPYNGFNNNRRQNNNATGNYAPYNGATGNYAPYNNATGNYAPYNGATGSHASYNGATGSHASYNGGVILSSPPGGALRRPPQNGSIENQRRGDGRVVQNRQAPQGGGNTQSLRNTQNRQETQNGFNSQNARAPRSINETRNGAGAQYARESRNAREDANGISGSAGQRRNAQPGGRSRKKQSDGKSGKKIFGRFSVTQVVNLCLIAVSAVVLLLIIIMFNRPASQEEHPNATQGAAQMSLINEDVAGMTSDEIAEYLNKELGGNLDSKFITLKICDITEKYSFADLGVKYDVDEVARQAYEISHSGSEAEQRNQISALASDPINLDLVYTYDHDLVNEIINRIADEAGILSEDAEVEYTPTSVIIKPGREGVRVDKDDLSENLRIALESFESAEIEVKQIMSAPDKLDAEAIYNTIYVEPKDAFYKVSDDHKSIDIVSEEAGQSVDRDKLIRAIDMLNENKSSVVDIPLVKVEAAVKSANLSKEFFQDKLGSASTNFSVNSTNNKNRRDNMTLATATITGYIMAPGDEFAFNETVGQRTESKGYKMAGAFLDGQLIDDVGGGICQVSSTLYNAVLYADLQVTSRQNHSFIVTYVKAGFDATVSYPSPEFKFKNTTDNPVKITCGVDGTTISFSIYGTQVGPVKKITLKSEMRETIPYETKSTEDPTMYEGTINVSQSGREGHTVDTFKTVQIGDGPVETIKIGTSKYKTMEQIQTVGTKPRPPEMDAPSEPEIIGPSPDDADYVSENSLLNNPGGQQNGESASDETTTRPIRTPRPTREPTAPGSTTGGSQTTESAPVTQDNGGGGSGGDETTTRPTRENTTRSNDTETSATETQPTEQQTTTATTVATTPAAVVPQQNVEGGEGGGDETALNRAPRQTSQE